MAALSAWFWSEDFWLPHNVSWADLANPPPGVEYPQAVHLLNAFPLALGIFALRMFFERYGSFLSFRQITSHSLAAKPAFFLSVCVKQDERKSKKKRKGGGLQLSWLS